MPQVYRAVEVYLVCVVNLDHLVKLVLQGVRATLVCLVLRDLQERVVNVDHRVNLDNLDHKDH